jgi:hypothetical protein
VIVAIAFVLWKKYGKSDAKADWTPAAARDGESTLPRASELDLSVDIQRAFRPVKAVNQDAILLALMPKLGAKAGDDPRSFRFGSWKMCAFSDIEDGVATVRVRGLLPYGRLIAGLLILIALLMFVVMTTAGFVGYCAWLWGGSTHDVAILYDNYLAHGRLASGMPFDRAIFQFNLFRWWIPACLVVFALLVLLGIPWTFHRKVEDVIKRF